MLFSRKHTLFAAVLWLASACALTAAEPWWHEYTPGASVGLRAEGVETIQPGAVRGVSTLGWYGFWFLDAQEQYGTINAGREKLQRAGIKRIVYYDLGEVGDYAGFFTADGKMKQTGWSLSWWKSNEPLTARWFGLDAFMRDVPWAPFPAAKTYHLKPFTTPDGKPADDLYAVLTRRGLDGKWKFDYSSNLGITDDIAERSGLAAISGKQSDRAEVQGKTGWQIVRLVSLDFANPQLRDYVCGEIEHIITKLHPDGIHADNFGDNNLGHANQCAFGLWSQQSFRDYMRRHFTRAEMERMGIADIATFDIAAYIRDKPFESRGKPWHIMNRKWADDPLWCCYRINLAEQAQAYHRGFYAAAKKSARQEKLDCAVFGNTIPFPLGGALLKGACDIAHFEWSSVQGWWGMRPMGLPPKGRVGYVTRLGAAISDAPFCWPSIYVNKDKSGAGHENLHKVLAFDCLVNRGLLDFGHAYLDGYSPGTPQSAGFVNRFIRAQAPRLSHRRYLADVALVHSAWSEIASMNVFNPVMDMFVDEYSGWCEFLGDTHRQWDVVLEQDLTAKNLARYPVVVLPSVLALTDAQLRELRRYVESGGRVVATGQTGTRYGPERYLAPREKSFSLIKLFGNSALPAPPHPNPLPLVGGEGKRGTSDGNPAPETPAPGSKPATPSYFTGAADTSLAPAAGERAGVRGQGMAHEGSVSSSGGRIIADKPGAAYWRKERDAAAARRMAELLDWPEFRPRIETDAPATVGVNLNLGADKAGPLLTLDLNNCDLAVETDTLRSAPSITTTIRLPDSWRGHDVQASYVTPEMNADAAGVPLKETAAIVDRANGTLKLQTPSFDTCLIVFIRKDR